MSPLLSSAASSTLQGLMCLAQGHKAVTVVRLEPAALQSRVKHSTTEPPCYLAADVKSRHFQVKNVGD